MKGGQVSDRWEKRKYSSETKAIVKKAKRDMADWIANLDYIPDEKDLRTWQAGYIYGINRGAGNKDK
jgi:hypothetical protein